jgi:hypothetical protein
LLYETGGFLSDRIPPLALAELETSLQMANQQLISLGITSILDASSRNGTEQWKLFKSWKESGILQVDKTMIGGKVVWEKGDSRKEWRNRHLDTASFL